MYTFTFPFLFSFIFFHTLTLLFMMKRNHLNYKDFKENFQIVFIEVMEKREERKIDKKKV